jgi:hypothetical protein
MPKRVATRRWAPLLAMQRRQRVFGMNPQGTGRMRRMPLLQLLAVATRYVASLRLGLQRIRPVRTPKLNVNRP